MKDTPRHMNNKERKTAFRDDFTIYGDSKREQERGRTYERDEGLHTVDGVLFVGKHRVLKAWESFSGWYWFGVEKSEERKIGTEQGGSMINGKEVDDVIWFGFVQGLEEEWGYFSEAEIRSLGNMAWPIKKCDLPYSGRRN